MKVKKRWTMFWLVELAAAVIYILLFRLVEWFGIPVLLILSVIWFGYYYALKYDISEEVLTITSGIIINHERRLPLRNVLWEMRLTLFTERNTAAVVLHSPGGIVVILGDISTMCC